jgi:hypothetical protein
MEKLLHQNDFFQLFFDEEKELIHYIYKDYKKLGLEMEDANFMECMTRYAEFCEALKPTRLLVNSQTLEYIITPAMQEWVAKTIAPRTMSLQKMAFIVSEHIFSEVSLHQMLEEDEIAKNYNAPHYFNNLPEAMEWVLA